MNNALSFSVKATRPRRTSELPLRRSDKYTAALPWAAGTAVRVCATVPTPHEPRHLEEAGRDAQQTNAALPL